MSNELRELSDVNQGGVLAIRAKERVVIRRMRRVVEQGALDATKIDDDGPAPEVGEDEKPWSRDRLRIAQDMRKSKRMAPVYLDHMQRKVDAHDDREAQKTAPSPLNIGVVNIVQAVSYPTKLIEVKE